MIFHAWQISLSLIHRGRNVCLHKMHLCHSYYHLKLNVYSSDCGTIYKNKYICSFIYKIGVYFWGECFLFNAM